MVLPFHSILNRTTFAFVMHTGFLPFVFCYYIIGFANSVILTYFCHFRSPLLIASFLLTSPDTKMFQFSGFFFFLLIRVQGFFASCSTFFGSLPPFLKMSRNPFLTFHYIYFHWFILRLSIYQTFEGCKTLGTFLRLSHAFPFLFFNFFLFDFSSPFFLFYYPISYFFSFFRVVF